MAPGATRWYAGGAVTLALGVAAGAALALEVAPLPGSLLEAHLMLNLGGWFGMAIVGTLHTLFPSLTGTRLAFPRLERSAFAGWASGIAALALAPPSASTPRPAGFTPARLSRAR